MGYVYGLSVEELVYFQEESIVMANNKPTSRERATKAKGGIFASATDVRRGGISILITTRGNLDVYKTGAAAYGK